VGHGRRLNSCVCRSAAKVIGREFGKGANSTDDDDGAGAAAAKVLPAFALDFGNGA
jgi:hypothetical protein